MSRSWRHAAATVLTVLAMFCSKHEATTTTQETPAGTPAPAAAAPAATTQPATPSANPAPAPAATGKVVATTDGEIPGTRIDVTELKRNSGDTVTLKFTLVNGTDHSLNFGGHWMGDSAAGGNSDYKSVGATHLIDPVGKKKYFVVRDTDQKCLCSRELEAIKEGTSANLWAKFPAPPADVQKITVVIPHFTPMDDVPIE